MDSISDDYKLAIKNKSEGISNYLESLGKLYVTPYGVFSSLSAIEEVTGFYRKSLLRRFKNDSIKFQNWYIVDADSKLFPAEECKYCDQIDDMLFKEDCWFDMVMNHKHNNPIEHSSEIKYLHLGNTYSVTLGDWVQGKRPHLDKED